jgi:hypothetical protein
VWRAVNDPLHESQSGRSGIDSRCLNNTTLDSVLSGTSP